MSQMKHAHPSEIHSFAHLNKSRQPGSWFKADNSDKFSLAGTMSAGWNDALGTVIARELSKEEVIAAIKERETTWKALILASDDVKIPLPSGETVTVSAKDYLFTWQELYTEKGKIVAPKYANVMAYRRLSVFALGLAARHKFDKEAKVQEVIPLNIKHYDKVEDSYGDCVTENTRKSDGIKTLDWKDMVFSGKALFTALYKEARFREIYKVGTAQKLYRFLQLDAKYPSLKLTEKVMADEIPVASCDKEEMKEMLDENAAAEEVLEYCKAPLAGKKAPSKMTEKADIVAMSERCPILAVRYVLRAILENRIRDIEKMYPFTDAVNKATAQLTNVPAPVEAVETK